jgi:hypothetical protein
MIHKGFFARPVILPQHHIQMPRPIGPHPWANREVILLAQPTDMCCNTCQLLY